jgi:cytochrome P450
MSPAGRHSPADPARSASRYSSAFLNGSEVHAVLSKLPMGEPMAVPPLALAPRRPTTDQTLMMALGLSKKVLQEQDFELDQRLRQLPSGPLISLHQESMIQHVLNSQSKYNTNTLIAGCPILSVPDLVRGGSGSPEQDGGFNPITTLLLQSIPMALPLIEAEASAFAMRLSNPRIGEKVDLKPLLDDLACRVLTRLILPATPPEAVQALIKATMPVQENGILNDLARLPSHTAINDKLKTLSLSLNLRLLRSRLADAMKTMRKPEIAESLTGLNRQDVLLRLLHPRNGPRPDDIQITRILHSLFGGLRDQLRTILLWTFGLLAHQDQIRHICEMEADLLAKAKAPITTVLEQALFIKAAIEESWRLYPPVPAMVWKLKKDDKIGRISLNAGSHVCIVPYVLHRHKDFWDHGDTFNPARFLGTHRKHIKPYSYMPFGAGTPHCPNGAILLPIMTIIMLTTLHRLRVAAPPKIALPAPLLQKWIEPADPIFVTPAPRLHETG